MNRTADLLRLLGVKHPIIQAPMVGVSTPELAAAVSNAGALGSIGLGASSPAQSEAMIRATRELTHKPFNVNLFCHQPPVPNPTREAAWLHRLAPLFAEFDATPPAALTDGYQSFLSSEATLQVLLREHPAVASFHFGLPPTHWIQALRGAGVTTLACVVSPKEAERAQAAGVDALIAQGFEAGGHRGVFEPEHDQHLGTFALVQLITQVSSLPMIAAGGIMNGRGIAAAMKLGASAVQMGTAFILSPESSANAGYRAALQSSRALHTEVTDVISGRPARGLLNRWFTEVARADTSDLPDYPIAYSAAKALVAAATAKNQQAFSVQWAGQGAPLARALPAAELVATLVEELRREQLT